MDGGCTRCGRAHLLSNPESRFTDLGPGYYQARLGTDRKLRHHIRQIQALGFAVTLTKPPDQYRS